MTQAVIHGAGFGEQDLGAGSVELSHGAEKVSRGLVQITVVA